MITSTRYTSPIVCSFKVVIVIDSHNLITNIRKYYGIHHITHGRIDYDYKYLQYTNNLEFAIIFNRKFI